MPPPAFHKAKEGPSANQLEQSVRIVKELKIPENAVVFAVAKPLANTEIYKATEASHVPTCQAQHMVQKLQGLVAVVYHNAWTQLQRQISGKDRPARLPPNLGITWGWKSAHFFVADDPRPAGCLDLLMHYPHAQLRQGLWGDRFVDGSRITSTLAVDKTKAKKKPENEEKIVVPTLAIWERAAYILMLTPFEIISFLIQDLDIECLDFDGALASLQYLQYSNFGNLGHYYRYAGLEGDAPINPAILFSPTNAALILFQRCRSYIATRDRQLIKTPAEFLHCLFNAGAQPPRDTLVREAHDKRAKLLAEQALPQLVTDATWQLKQLDAEFRQSCVEYGTKAGEFLLRTDLMPNVSLLTECVRDYVPDMPLHLGDPARLMRKFTEKKVERKEMVILAREEFRKKTVFPALSRYPDARVNKSASEKHQQTLEALMGSALAVFTEDYAVPVPDCQVAFEAVSPLIFPKNGVLPPLPTFDHLGAENMTAVDNLLLSLYDEAVRLKLGGNSAELMNVCLCMLAGANLRFDQDRKIWLLEGGPAGGKSHVLKKAKYILQNKPNLITGVTLASIENGTNDILPVGYDESDGLNQAQAPCADELLARFGRFFKLSNNNSSLKAAVTSQHRVKQTAERKDADGVHRTSEKETHMSADIFGTTNHPVQTGRDSAMVTRFNGFPVTVLGNADHADGVAPEDTIPPDPCFFNFYMLCVILYHFRACGLYTPVESEVAHVVLDQVLVSMTQRGFNVFESLFSAVDQSIEGEPLSSAYPRAQLHAICTNMLSATADMTAFSQETINTGVKLRDYNVTRQKLVHLVSLLHAGVSTPPFEFNDGSSLLNQRDVRHLRHFNNTLSYISAISSVFNGNAACGNFTQGDFFDRALLLENATETEIQHLIKGLELTNWQDQRLIDVKLAMLGLYIKECNDAGKFFMPDSNGVITIPNFFERKDPTDKRSRFFLDKLRHVFELSIWDPNANLFAFLFTFLRVTGSSHPLLFHSDFNDEAKSMDLRFDVRMFLYGELTACINGAVSSILDTVTTLAIAPMMHLDAAQNMYTRIPAAVSFGSRFPTVLDKSLWSQPIDRDRLFRRKPVAEAKEFKIDPRPLTRSVSEEIPARPKRPVVFEHGQGDGARKPVELPAGADAILDSVSVRANLVATNIFMRLFQINQPVRRSETASAEAKAAMAWYQETTKLTWNAVTRRVFADKIKEVQRRIIGAEADRIGVVNDVTRLDARSFSQLASRHPAATPVTAMRRVDEKGTLEYPRMIQFWDLQHSKAIGVPPVNARKRWIKQFQDRCRDGHNLMRHSQLVKETQFQVDMTIPQFEREERLERVTGTTASLYCLSHDNKLASQGYKSRIKALLRVLQPVLAFQSPLPHDDGSFYFNDTIPPEVVTGVSKGPVTVYMDDRHEIVMEEVPIGVYKGILVDTLMEFAKFMDWWTRRTGLLTRMVDRNTCHYWAQSLGLQFCGGIVDTIAEKLLDDDLHDVRPFIENWVNETVVETEEERQAAIKNVFNTDEHFKALEKRGIFPVNVMNSVFFPQEKDLPLLEETIAAEFGLFPVLQPRVV